MAVGRISGPLLKENLIRNGIDLAFETDLLYLDVNNQRIGIKTTSPTHELQISGTTKTTNLIVDTQANLADVTITGNTISSTQQYLNLGTLDNVVYQNKAVIDSIDIEGNVISTNSSNANLEFRPNGTGTVEVHADMNVTGNIHATGNITADGDITIGDANTDTIILNAEVASNIIPDADRTYNLGSDPGTGGKEWNDIYVNNFYASNIVSGGLDVDGIDLTLRQGNIIYVAENGSDANSGTHPQDPYASVVQALSAATAGDTIHIYPGVYTEIFPLTVPVGVTVKGQGLRSVTIRATTATRYNDAFLLNGESTVEDLMITGFYSGGMFHDTTAASAGSATLNVGTAPFAHAYVSGGTITFGGTDYAITNAVYTHGTGQLVITHAGPDAGVGTSTFIKGIVFSCNGGNRTFPDNGYAFRFATDFTVITRSPYIRNITVITSGSTTTVEDPRGFNAGDAGKGAYIDGAYATSASKEASMLFHSATFITPGVDCITATNGVRVEWLNSFTYFANRSFYAYDSNDGKYGDGKTRIRVDGVTGTFAAGETVSYYDTDGVTLLESATIVSVDGTGKIVVSGKQTGFEKADVRSGKTISAFGDAKLSTAVKKFGTASLALDGTGDYASIATHPDFAFPSTISRLAKTITANGNAAVSSTQSKFGGSSIAFDGTGDYLSIASDTDYGFGTGDFTIEGWFYKTAVSTQYLFDTRTTLTENSVAVQSQGNGTLRLSVNGVFVLTSSNAHTNNAWNHLAISRASGVTRFFINGVVSTTTYTDTTNYGTTKPLVVGAQYNGTTAFNGYIDDFRVSNTARYTATFTPTTTAFVDDFNTKLLIHGDSTIVDDAGGGTATDFTIEGWIYPTAGSANQSLFDFRSAAIEQSIAVGIDTNNQVYLYVNGVITITTAATVSLSAWTHVAVVRYNASTKIYINGTQSGSSWTDITNYGTTKPLRIGADWSAAYGLTGYIDGVTISKGAAVYTANFTAPITRALVTTETVLMARFDGDNNSTVFEDDVVYAQDIRFSGGATATEFTLTDFTDFGAEVRMIGSASVYGNYGLVGDGLGVIVYAIGHNLAYIGNGKEVTNDPGTVIQANEVIELNGAKVRYNSVDHKGDFRVGDLFYVNQEDGTVSFSVNALNIDLTSGITFTTGGSNTFISGERIDTGNLRISGNTIESLSGDITFSAATDQINLQNNVAITGNLDVTGDVSIGGNIQIGDEATDSISIVAGINSNLIPATDNTYSLGTVSNIWSNLYVDEVEVDDITINTNVITTTTSNADLELRANGTGNILVPNNDVQIDNNLTVNGLTTLANTNITGTVTLVGDLTQTGDTDITGDLSITQTLTVDSAVQFEEILVEDNFITTTTSNADLDLRANGSGQIVIPNNDVVITNDLTINGTLTVANISVSGTVQADTFSTGNILIDDNYITTTVSNSNLELRANGSGSIVFEDFSFSSNVISTTGDLILQPSTEYVQINSTGALKLPVGTTAQRPTAAAGQIRYNTDLTRFEGYNGTNWIGIKGVEDLDGNTRVTAELTEGANDNIIRFDIAGSTIIDIDSTRLNAPRITVDDIQIDGNVISTVTTDTNLEFTANGTGSIVFDNFAVKGNTITNTVANSITLFDYTGEGYVKFNGTYGMVLPVGTSLNRPIPAYTETGMMRFNTADARVEVFDGVAWVSVAGSSGSITSTDAQYLAIETVLYLG